MFLILLVIAFIKVMLFWVISDFGSLPLPYPGCWLCIWSAILIYQQTPQRLMITAPQPSCPVLRAGSSQMKVMPSSAAHLQILSNDGKFQYVKLVTVPKDGTMISTGRMTADFLCLTSCLSVSLTWLTVVSLNKWKYAWKPLCWLLFSILLFYIEYFI